MDIRVEGEWIAKEDAGGFRTMTDKDRNGKEVEDEENTAKTGFTDGTKRVAVLWGIGRYLYPDGGAEFFRADGEVIHQPIAHEPAPAAGRQPPHDRPPHERRGDGGGNGNQGPPRSGKALYARVKELEKGRGINLLEHLNNWAKVRGFPGRMIEWSESEVADAYIEAKDKLAFIAKAREPGEDDHR
jgi:hypothetical protein